MVTPQTWQSKKFRALSTEGKLAFLYMMAGPHQNSAGAYRLPDVYALGDLDWPEAKFTAARKEVVNAGLVIYDEDTGELYIPGWFSWNQIDNASHAKGTSRFVSSIESDLVREAMEPEVDAEIQRYEERQAAKRSNAVVSSLNQRFGR